MNKPINCFPGYEFIQDEKGFWHNMYRGTDLGFGGYVYAEPGMYNNVALLDATSLHPNSIIQLNKLGDYTEKYHDLLKARIYIKHKDYESAGKLFDGKLKKYLTSEEEAESLSKALKLALNAFFGVSFANFENPARDSRDKNNIIALRGSLFMRTLQDEVETFGGHVIAIRTDSIKVPNATPEIIFKIQEFAKKYGYEMEHECTYDRMCLVNDAVYIAKYDEYGVRNKGGKHAGKWTATGAQFQQPYVFKELFSKEPIIFKDMCEVKSVSKGDGMYLDMNEDLEEGKHNYKFVGRVGEFCPIVPGAGGGELMRKNNDKYSSVTGTKDFRWLESGLVKELGLEDKIDKNYYRKKCDAAIENISKYGDFDEFVNGPSKPLLVSSDSKTELPPDFMNIPDGVDEKGMPFEVA